MERYRLRYPPYPDCMGQSFMGAILEHELPEIDENSETAFKDLEVNQEAVFFSKEGLKRTLRNTTNIRKLVNCGCKHCLGHRPVGLGVEALVSTTFDEGWLILAILIYLGKLHFLKNWLNKGSSISNENLHAVMTHLETKQAAGLFSSEGEKRMFWGAYRKIMHLFDPVVFKLPTASMATEKGPPKIFSQVNYDELCRFPYLDQKHDFKIGSSGILKKFQIPEEYLVDEVKARVSGYSSCKKAVGSRTQYVFARKVLRASPTKSSTERDSNIEIGMEFDMLRMISLLTKPVADNIITLIAFYTWKNEIHFVFPFVESDLQSLLRDGWCPTLLTPQSPSQPLPDHWLWKQMIGVSEALSAIHTGLYNPFPGSDGQVIAFHFDLKPANILVTAEGVLKITDFGQSLLQIVDASGVYESGTPGGDLVYRAPESRPSKESMQSGQGSEIKMLLNYDVWSLACILMEVLVFILGRSVSPPVECPLADLDDRRSQEGPGIAYFGRNDVKACVKDELKNLRENLTVDDPSRQYMNSLIELLFSMFAMDNKNREFSGGVVSRLQKMHEKYDEDQQPEDPLIQLVKNAKQSNPAGHDEIGWVDSFDPVEPHAISFLYLNGVSFEQRDKSGQITTSESQCRLQVFYRAGVTPRIQGKSDPSTHRRSATLWIRWHIPTTPGHFNSSGDSFDTEQSSFIPIYIYEPESTVAGERFPCALCNGDQVLFIFRFHSIEDVYKFQAAILQHAVLPTPDLDVNSLKDLTIHYNFKGSTVSAVRAPLAMQHWLRLKRFKIKEGYKFGRSASIPTIASTSSSTSSSTTQARPDQRVTYLLILAGRSEPFIFLPLNDGQKVITRGIGNRVDIRPDGGKKHKQDEYTVSTPHKQQAPPNKRSPFMPIQTGQHRFTAPAIPLDPSIFEIKEKRTVWMKEMKSMSLTFSDNKGVDSIRAATTGTGLRQSWRER